MLLDGTCGSAASPMPPSQTLVPCVSPEQSTHPGGVRNPHLDPHWAQAQPEQQCRHGNRMAQAIVKTPACLIAELERHKVNLQRVHCA